jgi:hypothetical protein
MAFIMSQQRKEHKGAAKKLRGIAVWDSLYRHGGLHLSFSLLSVKAFVA